MTMVIAIHCHGTRPWHMAMARRSVLLGSYIGALMPPTGGSSFESFSFRAFIVFPPSFPPSHTSIYVYS